MQKLITSSSRSDFDTRVNDHLKRGWKAVPGTLAVSNSVARHDGTSHFSEAYAVILEQNDPALV